MNINDILKAIDEKQSFVEFIYNNESDNFIIGAIKDKENPMGFGRYEFVLREKDEQIIFLNKMAEQIK